MNRSTKESLKLKCPACGEFTSRVINSRPDLFGTYIHRERICYHCGWTYVTHERVVENKSTKSNI